jgi:hypothetical protein
VTRALTAVAAALWLQTKFGSFVSDAQETSTRWSYRVTQALSPVVLLLLTTVDMQNLGFEVRSHNKQ